MQSTEMVVIFPTYEDVGTVAKTLPSGIAECQRSRSALIVHDASETNREEMWTYLKHICHDKSVFLTLILALKVTGCCCKFMLFLRIPRTRIRINQYLKLLTSSNDRTIFML